MWNYFFLFRFEYVLGSRKRRDSDPLYMFCKSLPLLFKKSVREFKEHLTMFFPLSESGFSRFLEFSWGEKAKLRSGEYIIVFSVPGNRGRIYLNSCSCCAGRKRDCIIGPINNLKLIFVIHSVYYAELGSRG